MEEQRNIGFGEDLDSVSPFQLAAMTEGKPRKGFAEELWAANADLISKALFDPFCVALAQGCLPKSAFQAYIAEDAFFLRAFAEGYAVAADRCLTDARLPPRLAADAAEALEDLRKGAIEELKMHESYALQWDVDLEAHDTPAAASAKYVDWLTALTENSTSTAAMILAGMVPCLRLYGYIGCALYRAFGEIEHVYMDWVRTYCSPMYLRLPALAEKLLEHIAKDGPRDELFKLYRQAMQMEVEFFAAQPYSPPPRPINLLVIDFDDTCTAQDTTASIAQTAIAATAAKASNPTEALAAGHSKLQFLVQNYVERRDNLLEEILPEIPLESEDLEEFDMAWLGEFLDRLSDFDREMNGVVIDSGILSGVKRGMLTEVGGKVAMQPGCLEFLKRAVDAGVPVAVVSVNWSAELVAAAISQKGLPVIIAGGGGGPRAGVEGSMPPPGFVAVYANELEYFGEASTGGLRRRCECAADKGRLFEDLLLGMAAEGAPQESSCDGDDSSSHSTDASSALSVYIGDSMTDLSALISADVGIVLGTNRYIRRVAGVSGLPMKPLVAYPVSKNPIPSSFTREAGPVGYAADLEPVLYEANSWEEVDAFIFGRQFRPPLPLPTDSSGASPVATPSAAALSPHSLLSTLSPTGQGRSMSTMAPSLVPPRVLSIAGSDSGGGAGIQADLKTCSALGVYGSTAITAITAQNSQGVASVHVPPIDVLRAQIRAVLSDIGADAVKIGMLPNVDAVETVAEELAAVGMPPPLVVDPVLVATSGDALAEAGVAHAVLSRLFPLATIVTPNAVEAAILLGGAAEHPLDDVRALHSAAEALHALGPQWVLIKGGHLPEARERGEVVDVLYDGRNFMEFRAPYIVTDNSHGTGCTLATAIAAELATGADVPTAVCTARKYVWRALERSVGLTLGRGPQRALNHSFRVADWRTEGEARLRAMATAALETGEEEEGGRGPTQALVASLLPKTRSTRIPNSINLRVYGVTEDVMIARSGLTLESALEAAIRGGATVIQLREKREDGGKFMAKAAAALAVCRRAGVPLLINDRVDIALAVGADGVHVGQDDLPVETVRRMMGPDAIIGVSVKTVEEALEAEAKGADYLGAGAVFPTGTKDSPVIGIEGLRAVCDAVAIPVVGIGGVGVGQVKEVVGIGAKGVAVVSAIFAANDVRKAAAALREAVDSALEQERSSS